MKDKNIILENHAAWLWQQGMYKEAMDCIKEANGDTRSFKAHMLRKNETRNKLGRYENNSVRTTRNGEDTHPSK